MRTAAKVFVIISMVVKCFLILPIIIGIMALSRLNDIDKPSVGISIATLFLCSPMAGILMLCIQEEQPPRGSYHRSSTRCDQCGITDYSVQPYIVNNYLGCVTKYLCPRCAPTVCANSSPRSVCEECRNYDADLQFYAVTVANSKINKRLCPACREKHEIQRRSIRNNP